VLLEARVAPDIWLVAKGGVERSALSELTGPRQREILVGALAEPCGPPPQVRLRPDSTTTPMHGDSSIRIELSVDAHERAE
jgi:hypothetical protein